MDTRRKTKINGFFQYILNLFPEYRIKSISYKNNIESYKTKATELKTRKENFFGGTLLGFSNISRTLLIIKSICLKGFLVTNAKIQETHCSKFLCAIAI